MILMTSNSAVPVIPECKGNYGSAKHYYYLILATGRGWDLANPSPTWPRHERGLPLASWGLGRRGGAFARPGWGRLQARCPPAPGETCAALIHPQVIAWPRGGPDDTRRPGRTSRDYKVIHCHSKHPPRCAGCNKEVIFAPSAATVPPSLLAAACSLALSSLGLCWHHGGLLAGAAPWSCHVAAAPCLLLVLSVLAPRFGQKWPNTFHRPVPPTPLPFTLPLLQMCSCLSRLVSPEWSECTDCIHFILQSASHAAHREQGSPGCLAGAMPPAPGTGTARGSVLQALLASGMCKACSPWLGLANVSRPIANTVCIAFPLKLSWATLGSELGIIQSS